MPSIVQGPSPRDALSSARLRTSPGSRLGHRDPGSRRLVHPRRSFRNRRELGPRPRAPLPPGDTLLWTSGVACRLLQPETTRGHTLRAFDPRTRVGLSPRCSPAPTDAGCVGPSMRCRIEGLRAAPCTRWLSHAVFHLRGRGRLRAEALEQRRAARSWTISRVPFSWRLGHPGRRLDSRRSLEDFVARRSGQGPSRMPPREG